MGRAMTTPSRVTPSGIVTTSGPTSWNPNARYSGTPGNVAPRSSRWKPSACGVVSGLEDRPPQSPPRPLGAYEHRTNVGGLRARVEEAVVAFAVARTGVQPAPTTPASARNDLAADIVNEVRPVGDEYRVDVSDVHRRARGLTLVVEPWEQFEHRRPHDVRHRVDVGRCGDTKDRTGEGHRCPMPRGRLDALVREDTVRTFLSLPAAGFLFFVSAWLLMLFAGIVADDVGTKPFGYTTSMVATIGLWLVIAPAAGRSRHASAAELSQASRRAGWATSSATARSRGR